MNILILHKFGGSPSEIWYPWLKTELENRGHSVFIVQLPNSSEPKLSEWLAKAIEEYKNFKPDALIGHSLGGSLALRLLEQVGGEGIIKKAILVAPPVFDNGAEKLHRTEFFKEPIDWNKLRALPVRYTVLSSIDDPAVSGDHAELVRDKLEASYKLFFDKGHFLQKEFPEILEEI